MVDKVRDKNLGPEVGVGGISPTTVVNSSGDKNVCKPKIKNVTVVNNFVKMVKRFGDAGLVWLVGETVLLVLTCREPKGVFIRGEEVPFEIGGLFAIHCSVNDFNLSRTGNFADIVN